jgi:hypothetical protein
VARKQAAEEFARERAAEEAARKQALEEAAKQKALEEEARKQAAEEFARKRAAEEAARKQALEEAARKKAAEEDARKQAAEEFARKEAAEEAARRQALEEAAKEKALEEAAEEEIARKKALALAVRKETDEKAALLRIELAEQKRRHAEEAAIAKADEQLIENELRALENAKQAEEAALASALKNRKKEKEAQETKDAAARIRRKRQAAEKAARDKEEQLREEQASLDRATEGTARLEQLQKLASTSKKEPLPSPANLPTGLHKPQPGAPNLFSLRPFRNTAEIRQRAEISQKLVKKMFFASVIALLALLALGSRYLLFPAPNVSLTGASAIVVAPHSGLTIAAGGQLFSLDRSGVDSTSYKLADLGLHNEVNLLGFDASGALFLQEKISAETLDPNLIDVSQTQWRILGCHLETSLCIPYADELDQGHITSWVVDPRTAQVFLASPTEGLLSKLAEDGAILAQAKVDMPERATLVFREGLLYMNSAVGPAISIFRPDNKGFGEHLDEVLLLPPQAQEKNQTAVGDFVWSEGSWWVTLSNPETQNESLYRFDAKWNFVAEVSVEKGGYPRHLITWANKVLMLDTTQLQIQRFNSTGTAEAPLIPTSLETFLANNQHSSALTKRLWHLAMGILALLGIGTYLMGHMYQLRSLVYKKDKVSGAEPIDNKERQIRWIALDNNRGLAYKRIGIAYGIFAFTIIGEGIFLAVPLTILLAASLLIAAPGIALALLWRSRTGHIGVFEEQLVLVDEHNMYHVGSGPRVHYRNNFLLLDDVVVFIGSRRLPVFSTVQLAKEIVPLAVTGVKVDRKTVAIKLIQSAHPIAKGLYACIVCIALAIICLLF